MNCCLRCLFSLGDYCGCCKEEEETHDDRLLRMGAEKRVIDKRCEKGGVPVPPCMPPSNPATVVCEQPKPSKVPIPKKAEALSEPYSLSDTQTGSPVIK
ncbi:hypothetical protein AAVH_41170, partial [Aphelenchoides avenae]